MLSLVFVISSISHILPDGGRVEVVESYVRRTWPNIRSFDHERNMRILLIRKCFASWDTMLTYLPLLEHVQLPVAKPLTNMVPMIRREDDYSLLQLPSGVKLVQQIIYQFVNARQRLCTPSIRSVGKRNL